jgi:site-specific recombinase XerD
MPNCIKDYYSFLVANELQYTTCISYAQKAFNFLEFAKHQNNISNTEDNLNINQKIFEDYMNSIKIRNNQRIDIYTSADYRSTVWSALNSFFTYLERTGEIDSNPCSLVKRPKLKRKATKPYLEQTEIQSVLNYIENTTGRKWKSRDAAIVSLFIVTGIRLSALREINCSDFNEDCHMLTVIDKGEQVSEHLITGKAYEYLLDWKKRRSQIIQNDETEALFVSNRKRRISKRDIEYIVKKYSSCIGKNVTPHGLRRTFGNALYEATGDIYYVQKELNHKDISTTERYLSNRKNKEEVARIMSGLINT